MEEEQSKERFIEIYDAYADAIFRFCVVKVGSVEQAEDLTQDTFMRFWDTLSQETSIREPRALLYRVARNLVIDYYRKHKTDSLDKLIEDGYEPKSESTAVAESEYREALEAMRKLPEHYRDVVYLRLVEELQPREIAEIIGVSPSRVSVRLTRGMKELKKILGV